MEHPAGEAPEAHLRLGFDRRLKLEFHGFRVTSDAGLLAFRELDDALDLIELAGQALADTRTGRNGRHTLTAQLVIAHARSTVFQMAEVAVSRDLFRRILGLIDELRPRQVARC